MRLRSLLCLSFPLVAITGLVDGAPASTNADAQAVTIQRFPLKQVFGRTEADNVQKLTEATAKFKASNRNKIEHAYLGIVSGIPDVAEQLFLWKCMSDASLDTTKPFIPFSSAGNFTHATALLNDRDSLLRVLNSPITETVINDILPQISTTQVDKDLSLLVVNIRESGLGFGGSHGFEIDGDKRTLLGVNGWPSQQAVSDWIAGQDEETAAVFARFSESFVGGLQAVPLFKHVVEVLTWA